MRHSRTVRVAFGLVGAAAALLSVSGLLAGCARTPEVTPSGAVSVSPASTVESSTSTGSFANHGPLPDPAVAPGQWIAVTDAGLRPQLLVSTVELPIVWENRSKAPVRIRYDNGTVDSGMIAPGQAFQTTPDAAVAITYDVIGQRTLQGVIQVEPPLMPGETPFHDPPKDYPDLNWPYVSPTPGAVAGVSDPVP